MEIAERLCKNAGTEMEIGLHSYIAIKLKQFKRSDNGKKPLEILFFFLFNLVVELMEELADDSMEDFVVKPVEEQAEHLLLFLMMIYKKFK